MVAGLVGCLRVISILSGSQILVTDLRFTVCRTASADTTKKLWTSCGKVFFPLKVTERFRVRADLVRPKMVKGPDYQQVWHLHRKFGHILFALPPSFCIKVWFISATFPGLVRCHGSFYNPRQRQHRNGPVPWASDPDREAGFSMPFWPLWAFRCHGEVVIMSRWHQELLDVGSH